MESVNNVNENNICHDCKKEINIVDGEIKDAVYLVYDKDGEKINVFKCNDCYAKNPSLTNFQECEVYSRVVGYIRPVQQWHKGKKQEFGERQEFKMPSKDSCCD
jgi:ribonucleoside-triphosphate reductase